MRTHALPGSGRVSQGSIYQFLFLVSVDHKSEKGGSVYHMNINDAVGRAADGLFIVDHERRFVAFSDNCERITGFRQEEIVGQQCGCGQQEQCTSQEARTLSDALCPGLEVFQGQVSTCRQRMRIDRRDGRSVWVEARYSPMNDGNGQVACVIGVLRDITGAKDLERELRNGGHGPFTISRLEALRPEPVEMGATSGGENGNGSDDARLDQVLAGVERREILRSLRDADGQRTQAAKALGISRSRLYRRMEALGIDPRADV
jgi:PAS domain S-box-containing protein